MKNILPNPNTLKAARVARGLGWVCRVHGSYLVVTDATKASLKATAADANFWLIQAGAPPAAFAETSWPNGRAIVTLYYSMPPVKWRAIYLAVAMMLCLVSMWFIVLGDVHVSEPLAHLLFFWWVLNSLSKRFYEALKG